MITPTFLSTSSLSDETRLSIARIQASLVDAQKELSTGRHADLGVTLGASTGITVSMRQDLNQIQSIKDTNSLVLTRMQASQSALQTVSDSTQSFLSALVGAQSTSTLPDTIIQQAQGGLQTLHRSAQFVAGRSVSLFGHQFGRQTARRLFRHPAAGKPAVDYRRFRRKIRDQSD